MVLRVAIIAVVVFLGSCLIARQLALSKNHRPDVIIVAGMLVGGLAFAVLWAVSLVYGGGYTKIAAAGVLAVMPAIAAFVAPPRPPKP